jgi:O-methyltransferase
VSHLFDLEPEFLRIAESCRDETMTSIERMYALYQATCHVVDRPVSGDLVECGVWRGGSVMLMASTLLARGCTDRTIWIYDTFAGMPAPGDEDVQEMSGRRAAEILGERVRSNEDPFWGVACRARLEANLQRTGYPVDRFRVVEGDVLATLPAAAPAQVAILRLDTDWYRSTRHELEHLYPRLSPGGVLIVDDYGYWRGARKATDEYFASIGERPLLSRIDYTGRIGVKSRG